MSVFPAVVLGVGCFGFIFSCFPPFFLRHEDLVVMLGMLMTDKS